MWQSKSLKFTDSPKTQKSKYLELKTFFSSNKKNQSCIKGFNMAKNSFLAGVIFNDGCGNS